MTDAQSSRIDKSDIEAKLREIEGVVTDVETEARTQVRLVAVGIAVVVVGLVAYSIWRRRHNKVRVEVYTL